MCRGYQRVSEPVCIQQPDSCGECGTNFAGRKSTSENHMKKSSGVATSILKTVRNAARRQSVRTSSRLHFLGSGTG